MSTKERNRAYLELAILELVRSINHLGKIPINPATLEHIHGHINAALDLLAEESLKNENLIDQPPPQPWLP